MYLPRHFREDRPEVLYEFIRRHPLGALVTGSGVDLTADHLPMQLVMESGDTAMLRGHIARANPVRHRLADAAPVLVIFGGADQYISPSWYPSKKETGEVVPTWNYAVVHAHGRLRWIEDAAGLLALVTSLTDHHEATQASPWKVTDAPVSYIDELVGAIVGFEVQIDRLEGKFKASQNRSSADRAGVREGLESAGRTSDEITELLQSPER